MEVDMRGNCTRCDGTGWEKWFEDNREQGHECYHCLGTGKVCSEVARHDKLLKICGYVGWHEACERRRARDNNPDGEDFAFCAAENMMTARDYFEEIVMDRTYNAIRILDDMPEHDQNAAILMYDAIESV